MTTTTDVLTVRRLATVQGALLAGLCGSVCLALMIGPVPASLAEALRTTDPGNADYAIIFKVRLPRLLLAAVVGGGLSLCGAGLQGLLRNPLADPHVLGVSGGAALGAMLALVLMAGGGLWSAVPAAGFVGALATMGLVYRLAQVHGRLQPYTVILTGVVCNAISSAAIMFLNSLADFYQAHDILFWLMGSLSGAGFGIVGGLAAYVVAAGAWITAQGRALNLLAFGEESALQLGIDVERVRRRVFFGAALLVGAVVSVSGMIGFVGLIVPHAVRALWGADHRLLLPASGLAGAIFLVWADTAARSLLSPLELPVGVITAATGGPFFLYLLHSRGQQHGV